jgi:hypothetical protein
MNLIGRGILAVIVGAILGSVVNMGVITIGGAMIPPPAGVDVNSMESMSASMHLFEPKHYAAPFIAHLLGTLIGAFTAGLIAMSYKMQFALGIGAMFLAGGIFASFIIPAPAWFIALDLGAAYIPMGWLGGMLAMKLATNPDTNL